LIKRKTLLLLNNALCHAASEVLEKEAQLAGYPEFKVIYLLSNVTFLIQPMDQGVIEKMKKNLQERNGKKAVYIG